MIYYSPSTEVQGVECTDIISLQTGQPTTSIHLNWVLVRRAESPACPQIIQRHNLHFNKIPRGSLYKVKLKKYCFKTSNSLILQQGCWRAAFIQLTEISHSVGLQKEEQIYFFCPHEGSYARQWNQVSCDLRGEPSLLWLASTHNIFRVTSSDIQENRHRTWMVKRGKFCCQLVFLEQDMKNQAEGRVNIVYSEKKKPTTQNYLQDFSAHSIPFPDCRRLVGQQCCLKKAHCGQ